ncbi:MAG: type I glyceraldehyde-3-phosphate dehydrogenase [Planctomycetes bacterium]|nr:type I glyceraldehyde-3-phosphate dehydrogenase [Planctomycetota bacterium]
MSIRVAVNGFGRIGRLAFRCMIARPEFEIVAINDVTDVKTNAHLLKYDTVFRRFEGDVGTREGALVVDGKEVKALSEKDPARLPWKSMDIDWVIESTGLFMTREACARHLSAGAKRVLLSAPAKDQVDITAVLGVNHDQVRPEHKIISNASCTTNCLAPVAKVLNDRFGIVKGFMTTVHAYTNDQRTADQVHKDLRRARAAGQNIIPTSTGAAKAIGLVIPELDGKLDGIAMRVPVADGSAVDLAVELKRSVTKDQVNAAMRDASAGPLKGILEYCEDPIVSSDVIGNAHSSVFDALSTMVLGGTFVKVVSWYDNEWAYSVRCADLIALLSR